MWNSIIVAVMVLEMFPSIQEDSDNNDDNEDNNNDDDANDGIEGLRIVSKHRTIQHIDYTEAEANTDNNDDTES